MKAPFLRGESTALLGGRSWPVAGRLPQAGPPHQEESNGQGDSGGFRTCYLRQAAFCRGQQLDHAHAGGCLVDFPSRGGKKLARVILP
ncbi:hypothetical protein NDU88_007839 [Pleurodeles waltl]|uniref:Uncharacterized protein n=1 Tax=Pleurodeles waltl TaxID=8319 RepID=A0AAV7U2G3_PLEWA|nr:hypothetical protein NDU88_007839 [Pleurodeles waltl]